MQWDRVFWALLGLVAPFLAYFLIFAAILDPVVPDPSMGDAIYGDDDALLTFQKEFPARINLGLTTTILASVCVAGFALAIAKLCQRRGKWMACAAAVFALTCGVTSFYANDYNSALIADRMAALPGMCGPDVVDCKTTVGERVRHLTFKSMVQTTVKTPALNHGQTAAEWVTAISALVGVTATVALILLLADVAIGASGRETEARELRARWRIYRLVLGFAAFIFALSVVVVRGFYRWPLQIMDDAVAKANTALVDAAVQFWGVLFTLVLIFAALPGFLAIQIDVNRAAATGRTRPKEQQEWKVAEGLNVVTRDAFGGILAVLTPVLTSPVLDALGQVFGALV